MLFLTTGSRNSTLMINSWCLLVLLLYFGLSGRLEVEPYLIIKITDPCVHINMVVKWLNDWTILQKTQENQEKLTWVVKVLERTTNEVFRAVQGWSFGVPRI